jgi:hypothetical protein
VFLETQAVDLLKAASTTLKVANLSFKGAGLVSKVSNLVLAIIAGRILITRPENRQVKSSEWVKLAGTSRSFS